MWFSLSYRYDYLTYNPSSFIKKKVVSSIITQKFIDKIKKGKGFSKKKDIVFTNRKY